MYIALVQDVIYKYTYVEIQACSIVIIIFYWQYVLGKQFWHYYSILSSSGS